MYLSSSSHHQCLLLTTALLLDGGSWMLDDVSSSSSNAFAAEKPTLVLCQSLDYPVISCGKEELWNCRSNVIALHLDHFLVLCEWLTTMPRSESLTSHFPPIISQTWILTPAPELYLHDLMYCAAVTQLADLNNKVDGEWTASVQSVFEEKCNGANEPVSLVSAALWSTSLDDLKIYGADSCLFI